MPRLGVDGFLRPGRAAEEGVGAAQSIHELAHRSHLFLLVRTFLMYKRPCTTHVSVPFFFYQRPGPKFQMYHIKWKNLYSHL